MIADAVRRGLTGRPKTLPAFLLYDEAGSRLYERITRLPEYYLTRAERAILAAHAADIVGEVADERRHAISIVELGAGAASKTEILLREVVRRQPRCSYVPIDVSGPTLEQTQLRLREVLPQVDVRPMVMTHEQALSGRWDLQPPQLVLFIGSSVGNFEDADAATLLRSIRDAIGPRAWLLLGTDVRKDPGVLVRAYDDAEGVTAAFNKNLLVRINRELGGCFVLDRFRHLARWNDVESRIEMHLESRVEQTVAIDGLALHVTFEAGETIHTESSIKYDMPRVARLLRAGGFALGRTFFDRDRTFAVHLARAQDAAPTP
jgi:dimethylhistidine N-methyltransferase